MWSDVDFLKFSLDFFGLIMPLVLFLSPAESMGRFAREHATRQNMENQLEELKNGRKKDEADGTNIKATTNGATAADNNNSQQPLPKKPTMGPCLQYTSMLSNCVLYFLFGLQLNEITIYVPNGVGVLLRF